MTQVELGPSFEPHVTVVGAQRMSKADACSRLEAACRTLTPYTCSLTQVACGTFFYQCIYVLVDPTPQVMQANLKASHCFGIVDKPQPYMPHLSLLYGDLPEEDKQKAKVKAESFNHLLCNTEFEVSSLCLYKTDTQDKSLQSWEKVAKCNLRDCTETENYT
ncbi:cyclic phosphodiesterase-like [Cryptomeria japonica]|uniref:cyclic phosphodiesterase-like n=1 Tax=Cryptomeria japonica TaxID=3369 RepID=UPI0027D9EE7E|nr:cyclic phosphodiesterase-like [Cryptomeria japonica]